MGAAAIDLCARLKPDVVVMDVTMPQMNGIDATRTVLQQHADAAILALSMHAEQAFIDDMLAAGARGFLVKGCAGAAFLRAIRDVAAGRPVIGPGMNDEGRLRARRPSS